MNPYEILGATPDAEFEVLKRRYRALVRENHPDLARDENTRADLGLKMGEINRAWALISDPEKRAAFDARQRLNELEALRPVRSTPRPTPSRPKSAEREALRPKPISGESGEKRVRLERAAHLFYQENRADEAIAICHRVLRRDYRSVGARKLLAEIHLARGEGGKALLLWEQIALLRPESPELRARYNAVRVLIEGQSEVPKPSPTLLFGWKTVPVATPHSPPKKVPRTGLWGKLRAKLSGKKR